MIRNNVGRLLFAKPIHKLLQQALKDRSDRMQLFLPTPFHHAWLGLKRHSAVVKQVPNIILDKINKYKIINPI